MSDFDPKQDEKIPDVFREPKSAVDMTRRTGQMITRGMQDGFGEAPRYGPITPELAMWNQMFSKLGVVSGLVGMGGGINDIANGNYVDGGLGILNGAQSTAQNVAALTSAGRASQTIGRFGPVLDGLGAINNFSKGDIAGGVRDTAATVLGYAAPELVAPAKLGWAVGAAANEESGRDNLFGGHRKASTEAADTGHAVRRALEKENGPSPDAIAVGGAVTLGKSVTNTIDTALNSILVPPSLRQAGSDLGGEGGNPFTFSILDGVLPTGREVPAEGPARYDVEMGYLAEMQKVTAGIAAKNAPARPSPHDGMYD